jgi:hypothetical protein
MYMDSCQAQAGMRHAHMAASGLVHWQCHDNLKTTLPLVQYMQYKKSCPGSPVHQITVTKPVAGAT